MIVLVPNHVSEAINKEIALFLEKYPEKTEHKEAMYQSLLNAYSEHGVIATLTDKTEES